MDILPGNAKLGQRILHGVHHRVWTADEVDEALHWAMEAWLMAKNYEVNHGRGWGGTRAAFWDKASVELRSSINSCLSKTAFLAYDLEGGFDFKEPLSPIQLCKKTAWDCLAISEDAIDQLFKDIDSPFPGQNE